MTLANPTRMQRGQVRINADKSRVITRLFVPGEEGFDQQESRASAVVRRVLSLDDEAAQAALDDVVARFDGRHHDLLEIFTRHADELSERLEPDVELSLTRRLLLGATFTSEFAIEGAALCNPSMVPHPNQSGVPVGSLRFIMSVRAIGEGHISSIGFRTGLISGSGEVCFTAPPTYAVAARRATATLDATVFRGELRRLRGGGDDADYVLNRLGKRFTEAELESRLHLLERRLSTRRQAKRIIGLIRKIAERTYATRFAGSTSLNERVLFPIMDAESQGMEDARFVRFTEDDGAVTYYASCTAYNGSEIGQQLLQTTDFEEFNSSPLVGPAAANKGLALFPRRIGGRFAAFSR